MKTLLRIIAFALMPVAPWGALAQGYNSGGYGGVSGGNPAGGTPSIGGGGVLLTGSNSYVGVITGIAATANTLLTGVTCPHNTVISLYDDNGGVVTLTARTVSGVQFSGTAGHAVDYFASCI
jgi:hypothetical protein